MAQLLPVNISDLMVQSGVAFGTSGARGLAVAMTDAMCFAYAAGFLQHKGSLGEFAPGTRLALVGDLWPSTPRILAACAAAIQTPDGVQLFAMPSGPSEYVQRCVRFLGADALRGMRVGVATPVSSNAALEKSSWFAQTGLGQGRQGVCGYEANGGFLLMSAVCDTEVLWAQRAARFTTRTRHTR